MLQFSVCTIAYERAINNAIVHIFMEKRRISIYVLILIFVFVLGFLTSRLNIIPTGRVIDTNNLEKIPSDYLNDDDILVYSDKIVLKINNAQISNYESNSMYPFLGDGANGIVVRPENETDVNIGDIITFRRGEKLVVHRVIEKGIDEKGVYFVARGDNSDFNDDKIRFKEIEHKLVGIIYWFRGYCLIFVR